MFSMPITKTAFLIWKKQFISGKQGRTQREGREKEGLYSLSIYPLACISAHKKIRKENRSDARWHSRKSQVTELPVVHPYTCSLEANTQRKQDGEVSLTANLLLPWWKNRYRAQVLPGNHISGRQLIKYQRENEYNNGLVRKDINGEGKSHRDTTAEGQFPLLIPAGKFLAPRSSFVFLP